MTFDDVHQDVIKDHAPLNLLKSYAIERQAFARKLVARTDLLFTVVTTEGKVADLLKPISFRPSRVLPIK